VSTANETKFEQLVAIMHRLRAPGGCPWDAEQTHASLKPYVIEEAHEVCDAVDRADDTALRDELGDLLLQVLFHAELAAERSAFDIGAVIDGLQAKLVRRHPHVFGDVQATSAADVLSQWSRIKREEREDSPHDVREAEGVLASVPRTMPALLRAHRLGERAGAVGFDWERPQDVRAKLDEELDEMTAAEGSADLDRFAEEIGDVLFTLASYARHRGLNGEMVLHTALDRFQDRFSRMESDLAKSGTDVANCTAATLEQAWQRAKRTAQRTR
jgi:tetrapyrrole methylase family protein/MazG family protein